MKYMKIAAINDLSVDNIAIDTGTSGYSFFAEVGNSSYDTFLEQVQLTDEQVKNLTPNTWYDFPEQIFG